ncbi:MAG: hypothetical protein HY329_03315 [Chloroflexi bacterium]|nr:hypothetical protein [Chloroflexota bacterium]
MDDPIRPRESNHPATAPNAVQVLASQPMLEGRSESPEHLDAAANQWIIQPGWPVLGSDDVQVGFVANVTTEYLSIHGAEGFGGDWDALLSAIHGVDRQRVYLSVPSYEARDLDVWRTAEE